MRCCVLAVIIGSLQLGLSGCGPAPVGGDPVEVTIPPGAPFQEVVDSLESRGLVNHPHFFLMYTRLQGADRRVRAGQYLFVRGAPWSEILEDLTAGKVVTQSLTIPEGFTLKQMAPRMARITGLDPDSVSARLHLDSMEARWEVPGPGLEGYLFPDTYRFAQGAPLDEVLEAMITRYRGFWTQERWERLEGLGMSEREVVTLASIVQAEARLEEEMPLIASVYHNRLQRGYLLQADPTVLYALGGPRPRLLYAAMDSVAEHPYNTYTHPGLPPGPIGAPGTAALEATLYPATSDFLYFVARTDGTHAFTRTLEEHNRAVAESRREWDRVRQEERAREPQSDSIRNSGGSRSSP